MIGGAITDLGLITNKLRQNVSDNGILPFFFAENSSPTPGLSKKITKLGSTLKHTPMKKELIFTLSLLEFILGTGYLYTSFFSADSRHEWNWFTAILSIVMVLFFALLALRLLTPLKMKGLKWTRHCRTLEYRTQFPVGILLFFGTLAMLAVNESAEMKYVFLAAFGLSVLGKAMVRKYMHEHVK